jgi:hypothetical protein
MSATKSNGTKFLKGVKGIANHPYFNLDDYKRRLQVLRIVTSGSNQQEFADFIDVPVKRWANYERGYPVPREIGFILVEKIKGVSVDWIWFGWDKNLSPEFKKKLADAEAINDKHQQALQELAKVQKLVEQTRPGSGLTVGKRKAPRR